MRHPHRDLYRREVEPGCCATYNGDGISVANRQSWWKSKPRTRVSDGGLRCPWRRTASALWWCIHIITLVHRHRDHTLLVEPAQRWLAVGPTPMAAPLFLLLANEQPTDVDYP